MAIYHFKSFISLTFFALMCTFMCTSSSYAQHSCASAPQAIERLFAPRLGTYSLWDIIDGHSNLKQTFNDFIYLGEGEVILAGVQQNKDLTRAIIKRMNRKGRTDWVWQDKDKNGHSRAIIIKDLIEQQNRFLAVGQIYRNKKPHGIWFGRFTNDGKKLAEYSYTDKGKQIDYGALVKAVQKEGWMLVVTERRITKDPTSKGTYSRLIHLNEKFERISARSFMPGVENKAHGFNKMTNAIGQNFYVLVGEIKDQYERPAGLVIRLDTDGNITWQRTYSRGQGLRLNKVAAGSNGDIIALGDAQPVSSEAPKAGALMRLDPSNGTELWQRFYMRDDTAYSGVDLVANSDGRAHILLSGRMNEDSGLQDHARIITLSPRGHIMSDASYTDGIGVMPKTLQGGVKEFVMISGQVRMEEKNIDKPDSKPFISDKGWLLVTEAFNTYKDPCIVKEPKF